MTHSKRRPFRTLLSATLSAAAGLLLLVPAVGADEPSTNRRRRHAERRTEQRPEFSDRESVVLWGSSPHISDWILR